MVRALIARGYTQIQIAEATGVTQSSISRLLTGTHADPRISTVRALEKFVSSLASTEKA
ncbi:MAG: helix-turn-helix transcriptional regulator [Serratia nevei]